MAELGVTKGTLNGVSLTFVSCDANGDIFMNDGSVILVIKNNDSVDHAVTIEAKRKCNQGHFHNVEKIIPTGETVYFENMEAARFADESGKTYISYDGVTGMEVAVLNY